MKNKKITRNNEIIRKKSIAHTQWLSMWHLERKCECMLITMIIHMQNTTKRYVLRRRIDGGDNNNHDIDDVHCILYCYWSSSKFYGGNRIFCFFFHGFFLCYWWQLKRKACRPNYFQTTYANGSQFSVELTQLIWKIDDRCACVCVCVRLYVRKKVKIAF